MGYAEPKYKGIGKGNVFEFVGIVAYNVSTDERAKLEEIAKRSTHLFGIFGRHIHETSISGSSKGQHIDERCTYAGLKNDVRINRNDSIFFIYAQGPKATEIGKLIEELPFVQFEPNRSAVVTYDFD